MLRCAKVDGKLRFEWEIMERQEAVLSSEDCESEALSVRAVCVFLVNAIICACDSFELATPE
jgi:hypothetical protein